MTLFGMIPVIFINSVNAMDYMYALASLLAALYAAIRRKPILSGAALGLAVGFRLSSIVYLAPLVAFVYLLDRKHAAATRVIVASTLVSIASWSPVLATYGMDSLQYTTSERALVRMLYKSSVELWGPLGCLLPMIAVVYLGVSLRKLSQRWVALHADGRLLLATSAGIASLCLLLFIYLHAEGAYLIPLVAASMIFMAFILSRPVLGIAVVVMVLSCTAINITKSGLHMTGPVIQDYLDRRRNLAFLSEMKRVDSQLPEDSVVIAGEFLPMIMVSNGMQHESRGKYEYHLTMAELADAAAGGRPIYFLPGLGDANRRIYGADPRDFSGQQLTLKTLPAQRFE